MTPSKTTAWGGVRRPLILLKTSFCEATPKTQKPACQQNEVLPGSADVESDVHWFGGYLHMGIVMLRSNFLDDSSVKSEDVFVAHHWHLHLELVVQVYTKCNAILAFTFLSSSHSAPACAHAPR